MNATSGKPAREFPSADGVVIAPSLLACDFLRMGEQLAAIEGAGVRWLHLDVMDGHFVENLSMGPPVAESVRKGWIHVLDAHLMVTDPLKYAPAFAAAGCDLVNFQIEAVARPLEAAARIRQLGLRVGVTLNPDTPADAIAPLLEVAPADGGVDLVLVMSVFPGFGGQRFMESVLPKCEQIRRRLGPGQYLEIDGGIDERTAPRAVSAGANVLVAGSSIFGRPDPAAAVRAISSAVSACRSASTRQQ
ncbi:MAG: Ribulose-phosphate 3-epimerase [Phycisphaerae bacterium]|nr:Ribulose-phosphate 3-epimerase [Phycisphaerae bacterium]